MSFVATIVRRRALEWLVALGLLGVLTPALLAMRDPRPVAPTASAPAVVGYTVAEVRYTLGADPSQIASVAFSITPTSNSDQIATVQVKLISTSAVYARCQPQAAGSPRWECPLAGVALAAADELKVNVIAPPDYPAHQIWIPIVRR
jgi:hypothetical protein